MSADRKEYYRRYREQNRERILAKERAWYAAHREQRNAESRAWRKDNPPDWRVVHLRRAHGMTPESWAALWQAQEGRCYLCRDPLPDDTLRIHVDHDHTCCGKRNSCARCRRGLACMDCNSLIGLASEDPDRLRRIADNLAVALARRDGFRKADSLF